NQSARRGAKPLLHIGNLWLGLKRSLRGIDEARDRRQYGQHHGQRNECLQQRKPAFVTRTYAGNHNVFRVFNVMRRASSGSLRALCPAISAEPVRKLRHRKTRTWKSSVSGSEGSCAISQRRT